MEPADLVHLPPMPARPRSVGVWDGVAYLWPVARAWIARRQMQRRIRRALVDDQRGLDEVLRELGRAARSSRIPLAPLAEEMGRADAAEGRQRQVRQASEDVENHLATEMDRLSAVETTRRAAVKTQQGLVDLADQALRGQADALRAAQAQLVKLDGEIRFLERKTPTEDRSRDKIAQLLPERKKIAAEVVTLERSVADLNRALAETRVELTARQASLAEVERQHDQALAARVVELSRLQREEKRASSDVTKSLINIGTLLNLTRADDPEFRPLYHRVDELRGGLSQREEMIATLDRECDKFDHAALSRGLITVAGIAGGAVILTLVLLLVLH